MPRTATVPTSQWISTPRVSKRSVVSRAIVPSFAREEQLWSSGLLVAGVDEAGRGAFAGPVVAAAVVFAPGSEAVPGVRDSKCIPEAEREELYDLITSSVQAWGVGVIGAQRIDEINILEATYEAMHAAIDTCRPSPTYLLIDGNRFRSRGREHETIVSGDALSVSIAAASIIAKVTRDRLMRALHDELPDFGFLSNKGYGTKQHREVLRMKGPTIHHRRSFLNKLFDSQTVLFGE